MIGLDENNDPAVTLPQRVPSRVLLPLGLAVCLSLFGDLSLYASLVTQLEIVGLSLSAVGIMLSVHRLIRIPGNPLAGVLLDRYGRRRPFILGMVLAALSTAGYGLVRGFWPFLLSRLAWGLAWMLIHVGGLAMVLDVSTPTNRGRLTGIYNGWMLLGLALGPLAGGVLVDLIGFRPAMLTCAGFTAIGLAIAIVALPETAPSLDRIGQSTSQTKPGPHRYLGGFRLEKVKTYLSASPGLGIAASLYLITQFAGEGVALSTASLLLQRRFGDSVALGNLTLHVASAGGALLALRSLLAGAVGPLFGHWSDRLLGRWAIIRSSLVIGILGFGLLFCATSLPAIVLAILLGAVSAGAALAVLAAHIGDVTPSGRQGAVMGFYAAAGDVGSTAGPLLAFALLSFVNLQWVYLICAFIFLVGLWLSRHNDKTQLIREYDPGDPGHAK
ncbi:MAG: MFS transporter [Anaerolineae bacterium]|nr:MAG: MFS transporter [Anaerolineae bacterium]